jgi:potassium/hydrogen antiporter
MCRDQDGCSAEMLRAPGRDRPGLEVGELRLPKDSAVSLIIRDERPFYPDGRERIKVGELLVVTPEDQRENTEDRLRAVG